MKNCDTCRFAYKTNTFDCFECRRHAPKERKNPPGYYPNTRTVWPLVSADHWCGDWEAAPLPQPVPAKEE